MSDFDKLLRDQRKCHTSLDAYLKRRKKEDYWINGCMTKLIDMDSELRSQFKVTMNQVKTLEQQVGIDREMCKKLDGLLRKGTEVTAVEYMKRLDLAESVAAQASLRANRTKLDIETLQRHIVRRDQMIDDLRESEMSLLNQLKEVTDKLNEVMKCQ